MSNLNRKFKERTPEETVEIIRNFFLARGITLDIERNKKSKESNTWSCGIVGYKNGTAVIRANGKGMSEAFSLASGHAELYERFCTNISGYFNPYFNKKFIELNNYLFNPTEKIISYQELKNIDPYCYDYFKKYIGDLDNLEQYINLITDGEIRCIQYKSFDNENTFKYFDPRLLNRVNGSVGMSAGNSLEEALNQGISEIYEHYAMDVFYNNGHTIDKFYILDESLITDDSLKDKIRQIKSAGYTIFFLDLSYNFNMPVLASVLIDYEHCNTSINFGSFPVFEIALERVITELYQGIDTYKSNGSMQKPFFSLDRASYVNDHANDGASTKLLPEHIIYNYEIVSYNKEIFLSNKDVTNIDLNQYYKNLNKKHNFNFYFYDWSLSKDIYAVQIVCYEYLYPTQSKLNSCKCISKLFKQENLNYIFALGNLINTSLNKDQNDMSFKLFVEFNNLRLKSYFDGSYTGNLTREDWGWIFPDIVNGYAGNLEMLSDYLYNFFQNGFNQWEIAPVNPIAQNLKTYITIKNYLNTNKYSYQEIIDIVNNIFKKNITIEDIENINNDRYLFEKIFLNNVQYYYNSQDYIDLIQIYKQNYI